MIKLGLAPALVVVALVALLTKTAAVSITLLVAGDTGFTRVALVISPLEFAVVAAVTGEFGVHATEWEFGFFVVIELSLLPLLVVMAALTLFPKTTQMDVVDLVAGDALLGCLFIALIDVAAVTARLLMRALELEVTFVVVKTVLLPACG